MGKQGKAPKGAVPAITTRRRTRAMGVSPSGFIKLEDVKKERRSRTKKPSPSPQPVEAPVTAPIKNQVNKAGGESVALPACQSPNITPPRKRSANDIAIDVVDNTDSISSDDITLTKRQKMETTPATPSRRGIPAILMSTVRKGLSFFTPRTKPVPAFAEPVHDEDFDHTTTPERQIHLEMVSTNKRKEQLPTMVSATPPVAVQNAPSPDLDVVKQSRFITDLALDKRLGVRMAASDASRVATSKVCDRPTFKRKAPLRPTARDLVGRGTRHEEFKKMLGRETLVEPVKHATQMNIKLGDTVVKNGTVAAVEDQDATNFHKEAIEAMRPETTDKEEQSSMVKTSAVLFSSTFRAPNPNDPADWSDSDSEFETEVDVGTLNSTSDLTLSGTLSTSLGSSDSIEVAGEVSGVAASPPRNELAFAVDQKMIVDFEANLGAAIQRELDAANIALVDDEVTDGVPFVVSHLKEDDMKTFLACLGDDASDIYRKADYSEDEETFMDMDICIEDFADDQATAALRRELALYVEAIPDAEYDKMARAVTWEL